MIPATIISLCMVVCGEKADEVEKGNETESMDESENTDE